MAVYAFGKGTMGQLGLGDFENSYRPKIIEALRGRQIASTSSGEQHSLAVTEFGDLYTWGRGREGQLGHGTRENLNEPQRVESLRNHKIVQAVAGHSHTVVLADTGEVWAFGKLHKLSEKRHGSEAQGAWELTGMERKEWVQKMIDKSMTKYLSGNLSREEAGRHQFGLFEGYIQNVPLPIPFPDRVIVSVSAGYAYSLAISDSGELLAWGFNERGQLGLGHRFNKDHPELVALSNVKFAACGEQHSLCLTKDGKVYSWGFGGFGQLGHGMHGDEMSPREIESLSGKAVESIHCGSHFSTAKVGPVVYSWGHSEYGQMGGAQQHTDWDIGLLGREKGYTNAVPKPMDSLPSGVQIKQIACGHLHNVVLTENNECFTWGWGAGGCLGHGNERYQLVPKRLDMIHGGLEVSSAGWQHSLLVKQATPSTYAYAFLDLVANPKMADFRFTFLGGKEIPAHRVFLKTRAPLLWEEIKRGSAYAAIRQQTASLTARLASLSPVDADVAEIRAELIEIIADLERTSAALANERPDEEITSYEPVADPVAWLALLKYIYSDHLICPSHMVPRLKVLGKRYELHRLVELCQNYQSGRDAEQTCFAENMHEILDSTTFADLTLNFNGVKLRCHKVILTSRSAYFARLFGSSFAEARSAEFNIDEVSPDVFKLFLRFLYTGDRALINEETAVDFLNAADRFLHDELHQVSESFLMKHIDRSNALPLFLVADQLHALRLKRTALDFALAHWTRIKGLAGFLEMASGSPVVAQLEFALNRRNLLPGGHLARTEPTLTPLTPPVY